MEIIRIDEKQKKNNDLYVVGIGASAGGLEALQLLFDNMPSDTGMAFIIVQHLSPDFKSLMPELLAKHTTMEIFTTEDKQIIKPNCVYLNQRNKNLHIKGDKLYLLDKGPKQNLNLPIDIFFHTLGEEYKEKSFGIILSGTGSDGSRGIKTIKEGGGTIIVQNPASAQFDGMPNSAIATNLADYILPPKDMFDALTRLSTKRLFISELEPKANEVEFYNILDEIHKLSGIDFRLYKKNTLLRQLEKRMKIHNIDLLHDYASLLKSHPKEIEILKQDFLIGVTSFFRDTDAFESLNKIVIPEICKNKKDTSPLRVWVPGCSTGEEVYSIAILLDEYIRENKFNFDFKIFATDVDSRAINTAGAGKFHINTSNEIEKNHFENYFIKTSDKIQIIKRIREKIVFSVHNILKDPPFIKVDLITCRNMLIYFESKAQNRVMFNFHFALNKYGYLFLGSSESLGVVAKHFKIIDSKWKIYQNISEIKQIPTQQNPENRITTFTYQPKDSPIFHTDFRLKENPETIFHKYLSKKHSPASIFIDKDYNILFIKGDAGKRLSHSEGMFERNLLKMVNAEIASVIRNGIRRLEAENKDIKIEDVVNVVDDTIYTFDLSFNKPNQTLEFDGIYLIQFSEDKDATQNDSLVLKNIPIDEISKQRFEDLENELKVAKTELQNVVEELETSNEELQSSNEELMSTNEELQSTNEELQSVNEELYTVNSELQEKNRELHIVNNDISNLLDSTEIGTLFLDTQLRIRKFTHALQIHFNLQESDIGRPIADFASNFDEPTKLSLIKDSKDALQRLTLIESEIKDLEGNYYLKKIRPFVTMDKKIDGVVISFIDVNKLKEAEIELSESETKYHQLFENMNEAFAHSKIITDESGKPIDWEFITVNPAFGKQTGLDYKKVIGKRVTEVLPDIKNDPGNWIEVYGQTALTGKEQFFESYSSSVDKHVLVSVFSPKIGEFATTFSDISEIKEKENNLILMEKHLKDVQDISNIGSWLLDLETNQVTWTEKLYEIYGFDPQLPVPSYTEHQKLFTKESWDLLSTSLENTRITGVPYELELQTIKSDGSHGWIWVKGEVIQDSSGKVTGLWGAAQDITAKIHTEENLKKALKTAELANNDKNYFLANMSHEIRTPINGVIGFAELLKEENLSKETSKKYLDIINGNSKQLLNLIDDIIDVAKIESQELRFSEGKCKVSKILEDLKENFDQIKLKYEDKNIEFKLDIPAEHHNLVIITDALRLRQVVSNLLNNALKFSEKGTITFGFKVKNSDIKFYVKDQGIGIAKDKIDEIFERFKQLNYENSAKYGGTGLGLAICKGIVSMMGGSIFADSILGEGSQFYFVIPFEEIIENEANDESKLQLQSPNFDSILKNKTILIAEDEEFIRFYFREVIKNYKSKIIFANNGLEAVKYFSENKNIDLVLMDLNMPEMNGYAACKEILKMNPKTKIIAQTAFASNDEREKCLNSGFVDYITKPLSTEVIISTIKKHLEKIKK